MKKTEKAAIARIITDLIKADGIIDLREMNTLDDLQNKYDITDNDWKSGGSIHLAESLDVLKELDAETRQELLNDFCHVAMSDDFCAKEEALLLLCLQLIMKPHNDFKAQILSVNSTELNFDNSQMLYVEGEYDESINTQMRQNYREICNEVRLSGFELVYLPKVSEHYQSIPQHTLLRIASLLYPQVGNKRLDYVVQQMLTLNTATFCNEHLAGKLQMKKLQGVSPAFMIKIGKADIDDNAMDNFLIVYIHTSPVATMRFIMDSFARFYHNLNINYIREKKERFIFTGYYKQIFNILMLRRGIKSKVVVDAARETICFPEADIQLSKIHRREKALYALFLLESAHGGINFNKPQSAKHLERYERHMKTIKRKYQLIYKMFGGDVDKAPNIEVSEIRLPMISLLKKEIMQFDDTLYHIDDYLIQRNAYGNYSVNLSPDLCCCITSATAEPQPMHTAEEWMNIAAI